MRVWRDNKTRARIEKAEYIFSICYSSNRFPSVSFFAPHSFSRSSPSNFHPVFPFFALSIAICCTAIHAWRTIRLSDDPSKVEPRAGTDFLLAVRMTLQTLSLLPIFCLSSFFFSRSIANNRSHPSNRESPVGEIPWNRSCARRDDSTGTSIGTIEAVYEAVTFISFFFSSRSIDAEWWPRKSTRTFLSKYR